jgi:hypothetical protein
MLSGMSDGASEDCTSFPIIPHSQAQQHIQRFYHHLTIPTIPPVQKKLPTLNNTTFSLQLLHSVGVALQVTSVLASLTKLMMWLIFIGQPSGAGNQSRKALAAVLFTFILAWASM